MKRPKKLKKPDREAAFFVGLVGSTVILNMLDGGKTTGKLRWFGPYSLILEQTGIEKLYWKHGLKSIEAANGLGGQ